MFNRFLLGKQSTPYAVAHSCDDSHAPLIGTLTTLLLTAALPKTSNDLISRWLSRSACS